MGPRPKKEPEPEFLVQEPNNQTMGRCPPICQAEFNAIEKCILILQEGITRNALAVPGLTGSVTLN